MDQGKKIEVGGKLYGYWTNEDGSITNIRSESNPNKTPYLKIGSPTFVKVLAAIRAVQS